ncbi:MAG: hypothetical protein K5668_00555 [Lachnospiraceae bacterium]|nr:hypothetical protein [Lachnospiraceae bacterium]
MLRYCENCKKDFEFAPLAVSGKDDLICPECGGIIGKNSRNPGRRIDSDKTEEAIGNAFAGLLHMSYIFYMVMGLLGVAGYVFGINKLLYLATVISLAAFIIQFMTGTLLFMSGIIFLPLGAVAGYFYFKGIEGACLGIHIVFLIRHLIRDIFFSLLFKLIRMSSE